MQHINNSGANAMLIIGIDPDVYLSGVATMFPNKRIALSKLTFFGLLDYLTAIKDNIKVVKVEAGYLNHKSNWHGGGNVRVAASIGRDVGRNHQVARRIVEMCKHYDFPVKEIKPFRKIWKGPDGKITHEELQQQLRQRGFPPVVGRTSQDVRDAALVCLIG